MNERVVDDVSGARSEAESTVRLGRRRYCLAGKVQRKRQDSERPRESERRKKERRMGSYEAMNDVRSRASRRARINKIRIFDVEASPERVVRNRGSRVVSPLNSHSRRDNDATSSNGIRTRLCIRTCVYSRLRQRDDRHWLEVRLCSRAVSSCLLLRLFIRRDLRNYPPSASQSTPGAQRGRGSIVDRNSETERSSTRDYQLRRARCAHIYLSRPPRVSREGCITHKRDSSRSSAVTLDDGSHRPLARFSRESSNFISRFDDCSFPLPFSCAATPCPQWPHLLRTELYRDTQSFSTTLVSPSATLLPPPL